MAMDWESWDSRECSLLVSMAMVWVGGEVGFGVCECDW